MKYHNPLTKKQDQWQKTDNRKDYETENINGFQNQKKNDKINQSKFLYQSFYYSLKNNKRLKNQNRLVFFPMIMIEPFDISTHFYFFKWYSISSYQSLIYIPSKNQFFQELINNQANKRIPSNSWLKLPPTKHLPPPISSLSPS